MAVSTLVQHLELISMNNLWAPPQRQGDARWWSHLCDCLRTSDVVLFAQSSQSLLSAVCGAEVAYATSLGKPVLAVKLADASTLPGWAATLPMVDFRVPTPQATAQLADLLHDAPVVPLPVNLPKKPAVPGTIVVAAPPPGTVALTVPTIVALPTAHDAVTNAAPIVARPPLVPLSIEDLKPVSEFDTDSAPSAPPLLGPAYAAYRARIAPLTTGPQIRPGTVPGSRRSMISRNRVAEQKLVAGARWLWAFTAINMGLGAVLVSNVLPEFTDRDLGELVMLAGALYGLFAILVTHRSKIAMFTSSQLLLLDGLASLKAVGKLHEFAFLVVAPLLVAKILGVLALSGSMSAARDLSTSRKVVI